MHLDWKTDDETKHYHASSSCARLRVQAAGPLRRPTATLWGWMWPPTTDPSKPIPLHLLGTDRMGRDMWSRLMYRHERYRCPSAWLAWRLSLFLGITAGRGCQGYRGGADRTSIIQRVIEFRSAPCPPYRYGWRSRPPPFPEDWSILTDLLRHHRSSYLAHRAGRRLAQGGPGEVPVDAGGGLRDWRPAYTAPGELRVDLPAHVALLPTATSSPRRRSRFRAS